MSYLPYLSVHHVDHQLGGKNLIKFQIRKERPTSFRESTNLTTAHHVTTKTKGNLQLTRSVYIERRHLILIPRMDCGTSSYSRFPRYARATSDSEDSESATLGRHTRPERVAGNRPYILICTLSLWLVCTCVLTFGYGRLLWLTNKVEKLDSLYRNADM